RAGRRNFPSAFYVPNRLGHIQGYDRLGQYAGWLGRGYNPLPTEVRKRDRTDNPYFRDCLDAELTFRVPGLDPAPGVTLARLAGRRRLVEQFDAERRRLESPATRAFGQLRQRAFSPATSGKLRDALDLRRESSRVRDRYGRHLFGQSALVGRRLI